METPIKASELLAQKGTHIHAISHSATVADAVTEMNTNKIGSILVMQEGGIVGILTERDILTRVVPSSENPAQTPVSSVMTRDPVTIPPEMSVDEIMRIITDKRVRHLPVTEGKNVLGLLSIGDITRHVIREREQEAETLRHYITGDYPG